VVITLSRQLGAAGEAIAARVAVELGLTLVDRAYVHGAALAAGIPDELLRRLMYEGHRTVAGEILDNLGAPRQTRASIASPLLGVFAPIVPTNTANLDDAAKAVTAVIREIATHDDVLILGQGGQALLQDYSPACHVLVVAPADVRVARVAERTGVKLTEARRTVRASDEARREYLSRYHNTRWLDPLLYHLVINTGLTTPEAAASLVVHAARAVVASL